MFAKLFTVFAVVTLIETYLLYLFGAALGPLWTLALILSTALLGAALTKREGLKIWTAWSEALTLGQIPEEGVVSGLLVLVGAVLLVTPGVLTDATGILLLVPPSRRFIAKYVKRYTAKHFDVQTGSTRRVRVREAEGRYSERVQARIGRFDRSRRDPNVIETEGEVIEERRGRH